MMMPLKSCVDWKLDLPENEEEATVYIKLDASTIKNPMEFTDAFGNTPLEAFVGFYCTNSFRLSHPKQPQSIEDIFVLGEMQHFDDWKDENTPSLTSVQSNAKQQMA